MNKQVFGTSTGRTSSKELNNSNTPKSDSRFCTNEEGELYSPAGFCGLHMGPRTKRTHNYSYDPLLVFASGKESNGTVYSDRLTRWYPHAEVRAKMRQHFGDEGDYYDSRSPTAIQAFLQDLLSRPKLQLTRIEEHCCQSSGYPVWQFQYFDETKGITADGAETPPPDTGH